MKILFSSFVILFFIFLSSCDRKVEESISDFEFDFQPLEKGLFWIYSVDETIYFGENDSENSTFFYRDLIRDFYVDASNEQVFIVTRSKSSDRKSWTTVKEYTMLRRGSTLVKTLDNQPLVSLIFPPEPGKTWNGNTYRNEVADEFLIDDKHENNFPGASETRVIRVLQEQSDDLITFRDNRYEVYGKGIGLLEKYDEVLNYCSRNDCLGNQLINSGFKIKMELIDYGKN
jgi:hypothetical protein